MLLSKKHFPWLENKQGRQDRQLVKYARIFRVKCEDMYFVFNRCFLFNIISLSRSYSLPAWVREKPIWKHFYCDVLICFVLHFAWAGKKSEWLFEVLMVSCNLGPNSKKWILFTYTHAMHPGPYYVEADAV